MPGAAPRSGRCVRLAAATAAVVVAGVVGACGSVVPGRAVADPVPEDDRVLVRALVDAGNRAGERGPGAQAEFLRATQAVEAPLPPERCFDGPVTLRTRLVERTLRPAPGWTPAPGRPRPTGAVYVVAAATTAVVDGAAVREDVASKHVVVRDGRAFGYAACPN